MNNFFIEFTKKLYAKLVRVKKNRVLFWDGTPNSGSNIKILYKTFKENNKEFESIYITRDQYISNLFKYITLVASSRIVVTSHGCSKLKKSQTYIEVWHGVPLKKLGLPLGQRNITNGDKYISSSETYSTILNACIGSTSEYYITGFPRTDYFFRENNKVLELFEKLNLKEGNKKIVFMPTFRKALGRVESEIDREANVFGFDDASVEEVNEFLVSKNIEIIMKLHPAEENKYKDSIRDLSNIRLITKDDLLDNALDIYEILRYSDGLITDYSSVYFDYLLLNKPIVFLDTDINEYSNNRGFMLEPLDVWRPGDSVNNYKEFTKSMISIAENNDTNFSKRELVTNMIFRFRDGNSCQRINEIILEILKEGE